MIEQLEDLNFAVDFSKVVVVQSRLVDNLNCNLKQPGTQARHLHGIKCAPEQWRRKELKSKGHRSGAKVGSTDPARGVGKKFLVVPLQFFWL